MNKVPGTHIGVIEPRFQPVPFTSLGDTLLPHESRAALPTALSVAGERRRAGNVLGPVASIQDVLLQHSLQISILRCRHAADHIVEAQYVADVV